ncbi:hypothetical protein BC938DRAFT_481140 [Jimgerdemannia flammicorona]|uniref:F-box domain-containing protein n=1 Tax=Jimgerdemannia flammicorona TaxID=994334 RepID=A0A433QGW4_9FUNG|nr:hypothetical protein BC938DRAFT_481140 [Jimgerdemannia flammicorona]
MSDPSSPSSSHAPPRRNATYEGMLYRISIHTPCFDCLLVRCKYFNNGRAVNVYSEFHTNSVIAREIITELYHAFSSTVNRQGLPPTYLENLDACFWFPWMSSPPLHLPGLPKLREIPVLPSCSTTSLGLLKLPTELLENILYTCPPEDALALRSSCATLASLAEHTNRYWYMHKAEYKVESASSLGWDEAVDWLCYCARVNGRLKRLRKLEYINLLLDELSQVPAFHRLLGGYNDGE